MFGVFLKSLDTDGKSHHYESGVCLGPELRVGAQCRRRGVAAAPEVPQQGRCSGLRSKGGPVTENRGTGPQNKILMTTPFFTNSSQFSEKLSPFAHNTGVGAAVVLKLTQDSLLVKMFYKHLAQKLVRCGLMSDQREL